MTMMMISSSSSSSSSSRIGFDVLDIVCVQRLFVCFGFTWPAAACSTSGRDRSRTLHTLGGRNSIRPTYA